MDSTGQFARITTFMKDTKTERFDRIEEDLKNQIDKIFPSDRYNVMLTGKALVFQKGTKFLVNNLVLSLSLAIFLIALFMAWMFRSLRMILVSLIPNLLPLIITAGLMGYLGVPIKPSTILVFSIAFGISVDDTIHYVHRFQEEFAKDRDYALAIKRSHSTIGKAMFYTTITIAFGFSILVFSNFVPTIYFGLLTALSMILALMADFMLLPALLLWFKPYKST